jgi:hypothetical protein
MSSLVAYLDLYNFEMIGYNSFGYHFLFFLVLRRFLHHGMRMGCTGIRHKPLTLTLSMTQTLTLAPLIRPHAHTHTHAHAHLHSPSSRHHPIWRRDGPALTTRYIPVGCWSTTSAWPPKVQPRLSIGSWRVICHSLVRLWEERTL